MFASIRNSPPARFSDIHRLTPSLVLHNVTSALQSSTYAQLRNIDCEFREGVLTLRGIVSSFFLKQLAQVTVASIQGVEAISNRLEVR